MRPTCRVHFSSGSPAMLGELIGAPLRSSGELVFTTGMVAYAEALTDPSYYGQILVFSYPLIGNYGIPSLARGSMQRSYESDRIACAGVIISVDSLDHYHWQGFHNLDQWLRQMGVPGVVGIDTRYLVQMIRDHRGLFGRLAPEIPSEEHPQFGVGEGYYDPGTACVLDSVSVSSPRQIGDGRYHIGVIDCGVKWNILRQLQDLGCRVTLVPWRENFAARDSVDAWLISNGPGNPEQTEDLVPRLRALIDVFRGPILGICLGHQLLALAAGAKTKRMTYGHRSHNQPVRLLPTRRGYITSQNHGYEVDAATLPEGWQPWFVNANDESIEGIKHRERPWMSVQFHPEAAGGPRDTRWILEDFVRSIG